MAEIICKKKVLVVEGKDEINFFDALLKYVRIADIEIRDVGGKEQFKDKLPALVKTTGFLDVEVLVIVRDADNDANATFSSIRDVLRKEHLEPPSQMNQFSKGRPKIGIFIMPGDSDKGMLEDLCLKTVEDHPAMKCVNTFIDCVSKLKDPPKIMAKARAQTFLAAMPEIANCIGIGAQKHYWNFDSNELADLKLFLNTLK